MSFPFLSPQTDFLPSVHCETSEVVHPGRCLLCLPSPDFLEVLLLWYLSLSLCLTVWKSPLESWSPSDDNKKTQLWRIYILWSLDINSKGTFTSHLEETEALTAKISYKLYGSGAGGRYDPRLVAHSFLEFFPCGSRGHPSLIWTTGAYRAAIFQSSRRVQVQMSKWEACSLPTLQLKISDLPSFETPQKKLIKQMNMVLAPLLENWKGESLFKVLCSLMSELTDNFNWTKNRCRLILWSQELQN